MKPIFVLLAFATVGSSFVGCGGLPKLPLPWTAQSSDANSFDRELSLARLNERNGQAQKASQIYESVLEQDPHNLTAHHRLGVIAAREKRFEQAMQHFAEAEKAAPPGAELLNDIGYVLYLQNDLVKAEAKLRQAVALDPHHQGAHNNLGLVLGQQGRLEQSLSAFRQAVGEADAQTNLAYVQAKQGNLGGAIATYHRALELDSEVRPAGEALVQLEAAMRRLNKRELVAHNELRPDESKHASSNGGPYAVRPAAKYDEVPPFDDHRPPHMESTNRPHGSELERYRELAGRREPSALVPDDNTRRTQARRD